MLGLSHEHHSPGGVRGRRPRPHRRARAAATAEQAERRERAFRKLQLAAHWADLHPATSRHRSRDVRWGGPLADESLGGDGTPLVAAFTPEPFALALGMSPSAGAQLIADALDLRHRLPHAVETRVPVGGAGLAGPPRRPPDPPPLQGRRDLGRRTARRPRLLRPRGRRPLVAHAIAAYDPETHEDRENEPRAGWDVTLTHPDPTDFLGTSHLEATGDTLTLKTFYDQVCAVAHQLFLDGDTAPAGRPEDQGPRHPHRPTAAVEQREDQGVRAGRRPRPRSTATPLARWLPGRSRSSAPPPSPRSATWVGHHQVVIQPV